jgi:hypothetical protein
MAAGPKMAPFLTNRIRVNQRLEFRSCGAGNEIDEHEEDLPDGSQAEQI